MDSQLTPAVQHALDQFVQWLEQFGEVSQDHQDFYAGRIGRAAKALYYRRKRLGTLAVAPMVFCEAFAPATRRFFFGRMRLPIADAHYAMGFSLLFQSSGRKEHYEKAVHFLEVLRKTRCAGYANAGWGYPFDWQTRNGIIAKGTPLITTIPYCYEAFEYVHRIDGKEEWLQMLRSIADHTLLDYKDFPSSVDASTCSYTPNGGQGVVNASAYRAFVLFSAARQFGDDRYSTTAVRNLRFVLESQLPDGSWPYSVDGTRDFIDHFHTCFVMKAIAKIHLISDQPACREALEKGVAYYLLHLFDSRGLPKPFSKAPRMTIYKHELYDYAECLNLCLLLRRNFPALDKTIETTIGDLLVNWKKPDGSFRSRKLLIGYDSVPMHRWGQSEIFRSLALLVANASGFELYPKP